MAKIIRREVSQRQRISNKRLIVEVEEVLQRSTLSTADFKSLKALTRRTRGTLKIKLA